MINWEKNMKCLIYLIKAAIYDAFLDIFALNNDKLLILEKIIKLQYKIIKFFSRNNRKLTLLGQTRNFLSEIGKINNQLIINFIKRNKCVLYKRFRTLDFEIFLEK